MGFASLCPSYECTRRPVMLPTHSVIASAATCPPKPLAKAEAIQSLSTEGFWIASSLRSSQ
jgi:hypothetical protein